METNQQAVVGGKDGRMKGGDIKDGRMKSEDIKDGRMKGEDIKDGQTKEKDIKDMRRGGKKRNYQRELDKILEGLEKSGKAPSLLLHSCCAPCSSYVMEYLSEYFQITVFYYNPNIFPQSEFEKRMKEQEALIAKMPARHPVKLIEGDWEQERFYKRIRGLEHFREGGERCFACYGLRLEEAAKMAKRQGCDYFTTTLSISPLKNAVKLNEIGERLAEQYGVPYLTSDFKKKDGYKRSIELSGEYGLYRQDYCGCSFSKKEREEQHEN